MNPTAPLHITITAPSFTFLAGYTTRSSNYRQRGQNKHQVDPETATNSADSANFRIRTLYWIDGIEVPLGWLETQNVSERP